MSVCQTCGGPLAPNKAPGRARKFCSDRCRKRQYDLQCVDCGARVDGTSPGRMANRHEPRCVPCANRKIVWPRERIIDAIRWWNTEYGEPPASTDWSPTNSRLLGDPDRAARAKRLMAEGRVPHCHTAIVAFGSWNTAIIAAGFEPRAGHGGGGNEWRRRAARKVAA